MKLTRRNLGKLALAAVPLSKSFGREIDSKIDGVQIGAQSYSFRDLPLDEAIRAMAADGLGVCELFSPHIEEGRTSVAPDQAWKADEHSQAARKASREKLRAWRLSVPMDYYRGIRKKFDDAGIELYAYNLSFNPTFTDQEIDRSFEAAQALGVKFITASTTLPVAQRLAPFVAKHKMVVAMHGHSDLKDPNQFATAESFEKALAMSPWFKINLDIGHFTAANFDAVEYLRKQHQNIVLLHLKDRKKNEGPNTPWGEGDTPIKQVLLLLKNEKYPIPALIEYEYAGKGSSQEEVKKCFEYAKRVLTGNA